jgi:hypothetical protein
VPDSVIDSSMRYGQFNTTLDQKIQSGMETPATGFQSSVGGMSSALRGFTTNILKLIFLSKLNYVLLSLYYIT